MSPAAALIEPGAPFFRSLLAVGRIGIALWSEVLSPGQLHQRLMGIPPHGFLSIAEKFDQLTFQVITLATGHAGCGGPHLGAVVPELLFQSILFQTGKLAGQ